MVDFNLAANWVGDEPILLPNRGASGSTRNRSLHCVENDFVQALDENADHVIIAVHIIAASSPTTSCAKLNKLMTAQSDRNVRSPMVTF